MRQVAAASLLAFACLTGCSSGESGPRSSSTTNGTAGSGTSNGGSTVLPAGGSTSSAGSPAQGGAPPTNNGGAPVSNAGTNAQGGAQGGAPPVYNGDGKAHVITWVPPYRVDESKQQLAANFGAASMADGLSYLALQFWITDGPGTRLDSVTEADITWFHDWARQHGVKILLCVHNNTGEWNWPEATRSFKDNREAFVQHLVNQVKTRDLDGVDLDLEGIIESTADDQEQYKQLVQALSSALHPLGKVLTMDSFHGQYNAPNYNWWPDLLPLVDGITSMGYEQSGMGVDYEDLVAHATVAPKKLMIGVPSYQGTWQNHTVTEQLDWIQKQSQAGTAIWDASLRAVEWQQASVWQQLKAIKSR